MIRTCFSARLFFALAVPILLVGCGAGPASSVPATNAPSPARVATEDIAKLFDYEASAPLDVQTVKSEKREGYTWNEITYASPKGGRVPALLLVPEGPGPFAGILLMHGAPGTYERVVPEAETLVKKGAVILAINAPFSRGDRLGNPQEALHFDERDRDDQIQLIVDLRRAVDLLLSRPDVAKDRLAYSGRSFGGAQGGLLAGVEKRIKAYALVVGDGGMDDADSGPLRSLPPEQAKRWLAAMEPIEPIRWVGRAAPAHLLFQNGRQDPLVPEADGRAFQKAGSEPKTVLWYDAGHQLNEQATCDRYAWLAERIGIAFATAASPCGAARIGQVDDSELRAVMEREIPRLLREGDVPGISIAVIRKGQIAWSGTLGVDPANGAPIKPETQFQAASLTKPVITWLVLRLADRGVLDLDQPLWTYFPEPRLKHDERARRIIGRHVLSHTSGLPNWGGDKLETLFEPGERFSYSGEGYVYLAKVVEKLTGLPIAELARREVFIPLGMTRSSLIWEEGALGTAGIGADGAIQPQSRRTEAVAAASLLTTGEDYGRFLVAVLAGAGLKPETRTAMLEPRIQVGADIEDPSSPPQEGIFWGLGWGLQGPGGRDVIWHSGDNNAWKAYVAARRDGSAGLVYFANSHNGLRIARELAAMAMGGKQEGLDWLGY